MKTLLAKVGIGFLILSTGIAKCIKVPLNQAEYDTYISFSYNIGVDAFCKSTLVSLLNSYEYAKACAQLLRWTYVNGKQVRGLVNRRNDEFKRCIGEYNSEYYSEEVESA